MTPLGANMTDFGKLYGVSRYTVLGWIRQGLPFVPTGKKHKLIVISEAEKWFRSRQVRLR